MRRKYRMTDIICGDNYITSRIYPEYLIPKSRQKKSKPTSEVQQKLNEKNRQEYLAHLASTNFTDRDYYITLTYNDEYLPENINEAKHELRKYIKRLQTRTKKLGLTIKAIGVTGYGSKRKRLHHHIIISGCFMPYEFIEVWKCRDGSSRGYVDICPLQFDQFGVAIDNLLKYFYKHIEENKKLGITGSGYYRSRNLAEPEIKSRSGKLSHKQIEFARTFTDFTVFEQMHPDYALADVITFHNDVNGGYYFTVRYYKPPRKQRRKQTKR
ncbi:MAG: hypothetical protein IJT79_08420 [Ruminococcus sp.]|nr:hypothetical protein [Ruminococcus sp.]